MSARIWGLVLAAIGVLFAADGWRITKASRGTAAFDDLGPDRYLLLIGIEMGQVGQRTNLLERLALNGIGIAEIVETGHGGSRG